MDKKILIIDADLLNKHKNRHPNLASMKISGYYKSLGYDVKLGLSYDNLDQYEKVFISKVFTDTEVPEEALKLDNVSYGGTGFFYDKAPKLPDCIEHHRPDYTLYYDFIQSEVDRGIKESVYKDYKEFSIGFMTKGCVRQCPFCVNRNCKKVERHSPLSEFFDPERKRIYLWDDNILAYPKWNEIFDELEESGRYFQFRQGLDIRFLTEEKAERLSKMKYYGDYIFAFDNIDEREIIEDRLTFWKKYCKKTTKLYVFTGFDREDKWDHNFWIQDIEDMFERIKILMKHKCLPYIMRFNRYTESPYRGIYINVARWCNQPSFFKKKSFREFCEANGENSSTMRYLKEFEEQFPYIATEYFDIKY